MPAPPAPIGRDGGTKIEQLLSLVEPQPVDVLFEDERTRTADWMSRSHATTLLRRSQSALEGSREPCLDTFPLACRVEKVRVETFSVIDTFAWRISMRTIGVIQKRSSSTARCIRQRAEIYGAVGRA